MVPELRWKIEMKHPRYGRDLGLDWIWPDRTQDKLAGANFPTVSPEILLLLLCVHGYKHIWSRLIWICDVSQLLTSHPDLAWAVVLRQATDSGLERPLAIGLLLAHQTAGALVPERVLCRFASDRSASGLAKLVRDGLFLRPGLRPSSFGRWKAVAERLQPNWDKVRGITSTHCN